MRAREAATRRAEMRTGTTVRRLAKASLAATAALAIAGAALQVASGPAAPGAPRTLGTVGNSVPVAVAIGIGVLVFAAVGTLIASRRPENALGWALSGAAFLAAWGVLLSAYAYHALLSNPGSSPGGAWAEWVGELLWLPLLALVSVFLFLLFPDGRLPSRRWRPVLFLAIGGATMGALAQVVAPHLYSFPTIANPLGIGWQGVSDLFGGLGFLAVLISLVASIVSIVTRFRRSHGDEREQLKWFVAAALLTAAFFVPSNLMDNPPGWFWALSGASILSIPIAVGVAILKYRLYDIDLVINKTVVYGALAAFITLVYAALVVGVGSLFRQGDRPNVLLSIAATAVVAVAFQPARERARRLANRVVYGKRATPYEALSEFADRLAGTYATDDLLPRMARILGEACGAARADVWLKTPSGLRREASWPSGDERGPVVPVTGNELPAMEGVDLAVAVRHHGELFGALTIIQKAGQQLSPTEEKLARDLAGQVGLVLRNVGLNQQLLVRLEELRTSRQRLVAAQDQERRKIERNLHDGAQQQLVALSVKLGMAERLIRNDEKARQLLEQVQADASDALETLRDLARGIYPPLLADKGLIAALDAQARKSVVPIDLEADGVARYRQDVEAAVYFCVLEALQNVAKYANASRATVRLADGSGDLIFQVADDGIGFDPQTSGLGTGIQGMIDRLEALGGGLDIRSEPGKGTVLVGRVPTGGNEGT